ncbi:MAG TPA: hypothetical protein VLZ07_04220 [Syntrophales bacterium]|nr:hypothetical protein [Syntrophales bacterium]
MFRKKRFFVLIPALALIPLLLGMTPIKLVNKMAHAKPFAQNHGKQGCVLKNCFSQSLISQNQFDAATIDAELSDIETLYSAKFCSAAPESLHFVVHVSTIPLRC